MNSIIVPKNFIIKVIITVDFLFDNVKIRSGSALFFRNMTNGFKTYVNGFLIL